MINAVSHQQQHGGAPPAAPPMPPLTPIGSGGGAATAGERIPAPKIQEPPKPRIDFDPETVQRNLKAAIEHLNKQMHNTGRTLGFAMDEALSMPVVTVRNTSTGEVIRQIPSEAVVKVAHTLESLKGMLYDEST